MTVYDYSGARPDPALLSEGVMRYLAPLPNPKVLNAAELVQLHQAMKPVGLVWEVGANDIDGGYDQGHRYGTEARRQARALGFPDTIPIYWAVDKRLTNITRNTALDYGRGFTDAAGVARPYGEAALIDAAVDLGLCDGGWCPETWGHSDHIVLSQVVGASDVPDTDANNIRRADWGGWHPDLTAAPAAPTMEDDDTMPMLLLRADGDPAVWLTDLVTRRHVGDEDRLKDLGTINGEHAGKLVDLNVRVVSAAFLADIPAVLDGGGQASTNVDQIEATLKAMPKAVVDELVGRLKG